MSDSDRPLTAKDAVELATRWLRFQVELGNCRTETVERDPFVAGYLWGFCGGILAELETSPGLFPTFSKVSRNLFGEADGQRVLARIHGVLNDSRFEDGEAAGLTDARRSFQTDRSAVGLIAHLNGGTPPHAAEPLPDDPEAE